MYEYNCKILRVIDGDTVDVDIDLGFGIWMHKERIRLHGIDTPESRTRDKIEKILSSLGHNVVRPEKPIGGGQIISRNPASGLLIGGSDPRKDGCALGF